MSRVAAYYNEFDKKAAAWLRELIKADLIAPGEVDDRPIQEVQADDLQGFQQCHFFAGIGGWSYALRLAGVADDAPVWTGSCPCQPFSSAGKRKGFDDERHVWPEFRRLIAECSPPVAFGEQVSGKLGLEWLAGVFADLEACGYACAAADLPAACVGAPHKRQRLFWVADAELSSRPRQREHGRKNISEQEATRPCGSGKAGAMGDASPQGLSDAEQAELPGAERINQGRAACESGGPSRPAVAMGDGNSQRRNRQRIRLLKRGPLEASIKTAWPSQNIACRDGATRRIPAEPGFLLLADGFWYRLADVLSVITAKALHGVDEYAKKAGASRKEVLSLVWNVACASEVREEKTAGGQGGVCEAEVLLAFVRDVLPAFAESTIEGSGKKASAVAQGCMLRDLREQIEVEHPPLRWRPKEQHARKSTDTLPALSQFLARCGEACRSYQSRTDAAAFPLTSVSIQGCVPMLRGYGNAIVPQVAAAFIVAALTE